MIATRSSGYRAIRPTSCVRSPPGAAALPAAAGACASAVAENRIATPAATRADQAARARLPVTLNRFMLMPLSIRWGASLDRVAAALKARRARLAVGRLLRRLRLLRVLPAALAAGGYRAGRRAGTRIASNHFTDDRTARGAAHACARR